jgi:hypothetical protein
MDALFRFYEVSVSAPVAEPLVPVPAGGAVTTVLTAERVSVTVIVEADRLAEAALLGCLAAGGVADLPGAEIDGVRLLPA